MKQIKETQNNSKGKIMTGNESTWKRNIIKEHTETTLKERTWQEIKAHKKRKNIKEKRSNIKGKNMTGN